MHYKKKTYNVLEHLMNKHNNNYNTLQYLRICGFDF